MKKLVNIFIPSILFAWFLASFFIDIMAVPLVFQNVSSRDEAARLGVLIFSRFNIVEMILVILLITSVYFSHFKKSFKIRTSILTIIFPLYYISFLTQKIASLNEEKINAIDEKILSEIQVSLDFYHHLYVRMDGIKLLIILFLLIEVIYRIYKNNKNEVEK